MKSLIAIFLALFSVSAFAGNGLDPLTKVKKASLVCGPIDHKLVVFSAAEKRVWYAPSDDEAIYDVLKGATQSEDIEGLLLYEYSVDPTGFPFPGVKSVTGSAQVRYRWSESTGGTSAYMYRIGRNSSGYILIFRDGTPFHGRCFSF